MPGFVPFAGDLGRHGPRRLGPCCLDVKRLERIDLTVLEEIVARSVASMRERYPDHGPV